MVFDIKYATKENFTKQKIYQEDRSYLVEAAAKALKNAVHDFDKLGYRIKIWDAYRPLRAQYILWKLVPDERYVANPQTGSRHNRGCAIDLTLVDDNGKELNMGTDFDNFTEKAHRTYTDLPLNVLHNRHLLTKIMEKNQFIGWQNEWWHFDFIYWENYPILDITFDEIKT